MKIGLVLARTPVYSETFFISKIKGLQQSGYDVTLFVQKKAQEFSLCRVRKAPKVFYRNFLLQWLSILIVLVKLCFYPQRLRTFIGLEIEAKRSSKQILKNLFNNAHILTTKLDWLHFGFATLALQSEHVAKAIGAKMAVSLRGYDIAIYPNGHANCYQLLWDQVDKVHSISQDLLLLAFENGMKKRTLYKIIYPAIAIEKFKAFDTKIAVKNNAKKLHFLTVARLHWKKGLIETLEALFLVKKEGIQFEYTIIGEGPLYESLKFAIYQLNLNDYITLAGKLSQTEIITYLKQTDIYLQYSISEGFCNSVLEAQAMGCLCIVSNGEGLSENVLHNQTGWVVPKMQPQQLANKILEIINLPKGTKSKLLVSAQERVRLEFNLEKQRKEFAEFYSQT